MGGRGSSSFNGAGGKGGLLPESRGRDNSKQFDVSIFKGSKIKSMKDFEKLMQMTGVKREMAFLSSSDGTILAAARGDKHSVGVAYAGDQAGLTLTHNHPDTYGGTFSTADINHLTRANLAEIRAVAKEGTYSLRATKNARPLDFNRALNKDYNKIVAKAQQNHNAARAAGKNRTEQRKAYTDTLSNWYRANAKKYGYEYKTTAHK